MTTRPDINDLFGLLDKWRHFAGFPLEARSEVLFALFLPTVLENCESVGIKVKPHIIPQFPLRQNRIDPRTKKRTNYSDKVDFLALSEDGTRAFLIELKTDVSSRRGDQDKYLDNAIKTGMDGILRDLKDISKSDEKSIRQKYYHLLYAVSQLCLIELPCNLEDTMYADNSRGVYDLIDDISILNTPALEVVYVQPYEHEDDGPDDKHHYIYFDEFANCVERQGNMGGLFAGYLRKWEKDPANHPPQ